MNIYIKIRKFFDYIVSFLFVYLYYYFSDLYKMFFRKFEYDEYYNLFELILTSSISLMGFILTAGTFLVIHIRSENLSLIQRKKPFRQFLDIFNSSVWRLFILSLASAMALLLDGRLLDEISYLIFLLSLTAGFSVVLMILTFGEIASLSNSYRKRCLENCPIAGEAETSSA